MNIMDVSFPDELGQFSFGFCVYSTVVVVVNLKLWFQSRSWSLTLVSSIVFSLAVYVAFNIGLAYVRINSGVLNFFNNMFGGETPIDDDIIPVFPAVPDLLRVRFRK